MPKKSELELILRNLLRLIEEDIGEPKWNHRFHPTRKWEIDAAWDDVLVGIEVQGGTYGRTIRCHQCGVPVKGRRKDGSLYPVRAAIGAHSMGKGYTRDMQKSNAAQAMGWVLFKANAQVLNDDPWPFLEMVVQTIRAKRATSESGAVPVTPQERGAVIGWLLANAGHGITAEQVATRAGMQKRGARKMLARLSRVLPIHNPEGCS